MLSQQNWLKLASAFGGAPEIPFFTYYVTEKIQREGGEIEEVKQVYHDFDPIKVRVHQVNMQGDLIGENFCLFISSKISIQRFNQYIGNVRKDCNSRQKLFSIRSKIDGHCPIYEAPDKSTTLVECGVQAFHNIVIVQYDEGESNFVDFSTSPAKMHTFYHAVAKTFEIPREEYIGMLPELPEPVIPNQIQEAAPYSSPKNAQNVANAQDAYPMPYY